MTLTLEIPDAIVQGLRLPEGEIQDRLRLELACALYARGMLSSSKAAEMVGLSRFLFGRELSVRGITRHYTEEELEQDLAYGLGQ